MPIHAVVTVDLDGGVSTVARNKFNKILSDAGLVKHKLTTLWTVLFTPNSTKQDAKDWLRQCIDEAARQAGITHYEVLLSLSDEQPVEWTKGAPTLGLGLGLRLGIARGSHAASR